MSRLPDREAAINKKPFAEVVDSCSPVLLLKWKQLLSWTPFKLVQQTT